MKNVQIKYMCLLFVGAILGILPISKVSAQIDPIRFTIKSDKNIVSADGENVELTITAHYLSIPSGSAFVLDEASTFSLKMNFPENFEQTGGTYTDYIGTTLSNSNRQAIYTVIGQFKESSDDAVFQLLRGGKGASNTSMFIEVGRLVFQPTGEADPVTETSSARTLSVSAEPSYLQYMTLNDFYESATIESEVIYITDFGLEGLFKVDATSSLADNGATVLVKDGIRYVRVFDGIINVAWFGIKPDGITNHTAAIQQLLNGTHYKHLYFPRGNGGSYKIGDLRVYSNTEITFEKDALISGTREKINGTMFYLYHVNNVTINGNGLIIDDTNPSYVSYPNEWRNIISIYSAKNILVQGVTANNGGGDGFYIGAYGEPTFSENVKLIDVVASGNKRQGLSIISGKNIHVLRSTFENTSGIAPGAGIDIEPNSPLHFLENIVLKDIITRNNRGPGVTIGPKSISGQDRYVSIIVENHYDEGSGFGGTVTTVPEPLAGSIKFVNSIWRNNKASAFVARNWSCEGPVVELINPVITNPNTNGSTSNVLGSAILVYRPVGDIGAENMGNIHIYNASIQDLRSPKKVITTVCFRDVAYHKEIKHCTVSDFPKVKSNAVPFLITHNATVQVQDSFTNFELDLGNFTRYVNNIYWASLYHNESSTATRIIRLEKVSPGFPEFTIEVRSPRQIRLLPLAGENIVPLSPLPGKYIYSNTVGSRLKLKRLSDTSWAIVDMTGTWLVEP